MPRIIASLSMFVVTLLLFNLLYGLIGGDYNRLSTQLRSAQRQLSASAAAAGDGDASLQASRNEILAKLKPIQSHVRLHMLLGILTALVTVLVQSIGVTYFIGTGRWGKEVAATYALPSELVARGARLKRRAFSWAMLGIGTVLLISCFGAAADPGTLRETTANWVQPHFWSGLIGTAVIAAALWFQVRYITDNQALIEEIVAAVHDIRVARGLPVEGQNSDPHQSPK